MQHPISCFSGFDWRSSRGAGFYRWYLLHVKTPWSNYVFVSLRFCWNFAAFVFEFKIPPAVSLSIVICKTFRRNCEEKNSSEQSCRMNFYLLIMTKFFIYFFFFRTTCTYLLIAVKNSKVSLFSSAPLNFSTNFPENISRKKNHKFNLFFFFFFSLRKTKSVSVSSWLRVTLH